VREESGDFVTSVNELRSIPPVGIDRVCQSYFCWIVSIPGIFGEAYLLNCTVIREGWEWGMGRRCCCHEYSFPLVQEAIHKRRNFISFGIKGEVSRVENVNLCARNILAVSFRLAGIE